MLGCGEGVENCWGRCGKMLGEVWESLLGCGEGKGKPVEKCVEVWR